MLVLVAQITMILIRTLSTRRRRRSSRITSTKATASEERGLLRHTLKIRSREMETAAARQGKKQKKARNIREAFELHCAAHVLAPCYDRVDRLLH